MPTVVVPLRSGSDGDYTHRAPDNPAWVVVEPPTLYLERIGTQWMQDRNEAKPGVKYILEQLPVGYTLYERPRANGTKDKYLFGHPSHKSFDSPNRFFPHFKHLMDNNGNSMGCPCTICDPRGGVLPGKTSSTSGHFSRSTSGSSSRRPSGATSRSAPVVGAAASTSAQPTGRPKTTLTGMDATRVDEEGTPDVYRNLIDKLKRYGTLDESIKEPLSLDWRAEQQIIPDVMNKVQRDPQWIPRVGDILLFVRGVPDDCTIAQDPQTGEYQIYHPQNDSYSTNTVWEAGLVSQAPAVPAGSSLEQSKGEWCVSQTGVRVEPVPNPNHADKSLSKQYTYVAIEHTRPFCLWEDYVGYVPREQRHPTIENAFTMSATMSLMGKHRFRGKWPNADIYAHAIYIGSELLAIGDTVRLAPKSSDDDNVITDILVVKSIRLKLSNLESASSNDYDDGRPYDLGIWLYGSAYTTVASRSSKSWVNVQQAKVPKSATGYGTWVPLHPPNKELSVPFSRVIGRLYEYDAMESWLPDSSVDSGLDGVLDARHYASKNDKRIVSNPGTSWYWADSRADALDLQTINGIDVGKHDRERDPKDWRKYIKITEAGANTAHRESLPTPALHTRNLQRFMAPGTGFRNDVSSASGPSSTEMNGNKRRVVGVSGSDDLDEDDEEAIQRQTQIVTNVPYKRSKIQVVID